MKNLIISLTLLGSFSASASSLKCVSYDILDGWDGSGTHERLILTAEVLSNAKLNNANISGAYKTDTRNLTIDTNYKPKNPKYSTMNRYSVLEDAWNWFAPILPKNINNIPLNQKFTGYIQSVSEQGWSGNIAVFCVLK